MNAEDFNENTALQAAQALSSVLRKRKHRRVYLGEEIWVSGQLGEALHLPKIINRLSSKARTHRAQGLVDFQGLWITLSSSTQTQTLEHIGWYDVNELDWEDRRSNRKPSLNDE